LAGFPLTMSLNLGTRLGAYEVAAKIGQGGMGEVYKATDTRLHRTDWCLNERARVFLNVENLSDIRQTRYEPLTRPSRNSDGRWAVDAWAPIEGRTLNAGIRWSL
jgi:serine/threonine protein kinase